MDLTNEQTQAYFAHGCVRCVYCESNDLTPRKIHMDFDGSLRQDIHCENCGRTWTDCYQIRSLIDQHGNVHDCANDGDKVSVLALAHAKAAMLSDSGDAEFEALFELVKELDPVWIANVYQKQ
jgi:hypothetical protein